ncbi:energy-coupling factor transporter transmembrane protein EcfT [Bacillus shivajii]|uniref:energy-coupling factor transporter transmembrane component T family protein n=1 Tax=Bacillus shivajii TaxID=1983719 RepID=UPI001CF95497|nr:energy-coupling factor transporter transmembrane component T [Bacillus shivajii]UCZ55199.1 energy-coupling factor transporter transmembrane protein EcfT [Bacillus shivajii]
MLDNVIIGQYVSGKSFIHKMDPRAKMVAVFLFMIFLFISRHPASLGAAMIVTIASLYIANIPLRFFIKGMRVIFIILFFTLLFHVFFTREGQVLFEWRFMTVYLGGVIEGSIVAIRLLMLVMMASLLTLTTTPVDLTDAIERLLSPLKRIGLPIHELALTISIALRFIPTLLDETSKIIKAQMARGAQFTEGSLWRRLKALTPIFIPLFVQAFKRAEDLAVAMEARGYAGGEGRTKFRELDWQRKDTFALSVIGIFMLISASTRVLFS